MTSYNLLFLGLFLTFLGACSRGGQRINPNSIDIIVLDQIQKACLTEYHRGNQRKMVYRELANDRSEPGRGSSAKRFYEQMENLDASLVEFFNISLDLKKASVVEMSERKRIRLHNDGSIIRPFQLSVDLKELKYISNPNEAIKKLKNEIRKIRKQFSESVLYHPNNTDELYSFEDPELERFESFEKTGLLIDEAYTISNVSQDDQEALKRIYLALTKSICSDNTIFNSPIEILIYVSTLEYTVLEARADAMALISSRMCIAEYGFDKITPIIGAPDVCLAGDTIEIYALMAAYDSDKIPLGIINGEPFSEMNSGIVKHKIVIPNQNKLKLKGSLTIRNKSGVPITMPFEKTIRIIQKEK